MANKPVRRSLETPDAKLERIANEQELSALRDELLRQRDETRVLRRRLDSERLEAKNYLEKREAELDARAEKLRRDFEKRESESEQKLMEQLIRLENKNSEVHERNTAAMQRASNELKEVEKRRSQLSEEMKKKRTKSFKKLHRNLLAV